VQHPGIIGHYIAFDCFNYPDSLHKAEGARFVASGYSDMEIWLQPGVRSCILGFLVLMKTNLLQP